MKDAYYFPHDYNARNDERIMYILSKYGVQGYGIYWFFVEQLHDEPNSKLKHSLLEVYAFQWHVKKDLLLKFYNDAIEIGLFETDGEYFWSNRVFRNKERREEIKKIRSVVGKKGAEVRWGTSDDNMAKNSKTMANDSNPIAIAIANDSNAMANDAKGKEIGKEKKGDLERKGNIEPKPCPDSDGIVNISDKKATLKAEHKHRDDLVSQFFEEFWEFYPRKEAKKDAEKAFRKIFPYNVSNEQCTVRIQNLGACVTALKREGRERKHIPLPATLLNREDFDVPFVIEDDCEGEWVDVVEGEA